MISTKLYDIREYEYRLAKLEKEKNNERFDAINQVNLRIQNTWENINSVFEIIDFSLGAVKFKDYEWALSEKSSFKDLYSEKYDNHSYKYLLNTDDGKILRGCECYYFLPAFKERTKDVDKFLINKWLTNIKVYLNKCLVILKENITLTTINKKYLLSILDHTRMLSTIMSIYKINLTAATKQYIRTFSCLEDLYEIKYIKFLDQSNSMYLKLFLDGLIEIDKLELLIRNIIYFLELDINEISKLNNNNVLKVSFKIHREIDCLIENYLSIQNAYSNMIDKKPFGEKKILLIGILNGAIELPVLFSQIASNCDFSFGFYCDFRDYIDRHSSQENLVINNSNNEYKDIIVLDDNIMTGKTIDNLLKFFNKEINYKIVLVRHPNINRIHQVYDGSCCIDFAELTKKAYGMIFASPYSKIRPFTNYKKEYLDELGIFTLTGDRFLKLLYKNNYFWEKSEVSTIRGILNE